MANRGTSVDGGWKLVSFGLCVFSCSFGIRSIVLCKCSGKYIDIYFILKITCLRYPPVGGSTRQTSHSPNQLAAIHNLTASKTGCLAVLS